MMQYVQRAARTSISWLGILISLLCQSAAAVDRPFILTDKNDATYQSHLVYGGEFIATGLYYRNPRSAIWMRAGASDDYKELVRCPVALSSLEYTGSWQGHLNGDGSCGPVEEPSFFATGNRINFDVLLDQDVSSK